MHTPPPTASLAHPPVLSCRWPHILPVGLLGHRFTVELLSARPPIVDLVDAAAVQAHAAACKARGNEAFKAKDNGTAVACRAHP